MGHLLALAIKGVHTDNDENYSCTKMTAENFWSNFVTKLSVFKGYNAGMAQYLTASVAEGDRRRRYMYLVSGFQCRPGTPRLESCLFNDGSRLGNCSTLHTAGIYCYSDDGKVPRRKYKNWYDDLVDRILVANRRNSRKVFRDAFGLWSLVFERLIEIISLSLIVCVRIITDAFSYGI